MTLTRFEFTDRVRPVMEVGIGSTVIDEGAGIWDVSLWDAPGSIWNGDEPLWRDVACDVIDAHIELGRGRISDAFPVGTADVTVSNVSGWADPSIDQVDSSVGWFTFPGDEDNYISIEPYAALDVGDLCVVFRFRTDDWPPPYLTGEIADFKGWALLITAGLDLQAWVTKSGGGIEVISSGPITPSTDWRWFALALDVNNGAGGHAWKWWYGGNGDNQSAWVEYASGTGTGLLDIPLPALPVIIGTDVANGFQGEISHLSVRDGFGPGLTVGGTTVFEFNGWDLRDSNVPPSTFAPPALFAEYPDESGLYEELGETSEFVESPPGSGLYEWVGV